MKNLKFLTMLSIVIAYLLAIGNVAAAPYQELEPRKGYIPVYIRYGDTPLTEIHPKLAEAFNEDEPKNNRKDQIESADLKEIKDTTAEIGAGSTIAEKSENESDIASFDVIKGKDETLKKI